MSSIHFGEATKLPFMPVSTSSTTDSIKKEGRIHLFTNDNKGIKANIEGVKSQTLDKSNFLDRAYIKAANFTEKKWVKINAKTSDSTDAKVVYVNIKSLSKRLGVDEKTLRKEAKLGKLEERIIEKQKANNTKNSHEQITIHNEKALGLAQASRSKLIATDKQNATSRLQDRNVDAAEQKKVFDAFQNNLPDVKKEIQLNLKNYINEAKMNSMGSVRKEMTINNQKVNFTVLHNGNVFIHIPHSEIGIGTSKNVSLSYHMQTGKIQAHAEVKRNNCFRNERMNGDTRSDQVIQRENKARDFEKINGDIVAHHEFKNSNHIHRILGVGVFQKQPDGSIESEYDKFQSDPNSDTQHPFHFEVFSELCLNGNLEDVFKKNADSPNAATTIISYVTELFSGLEEMHSKGIFHFDLNQSNVFIGNKGEPLLADNDTLLDLKSLGDDLNAIKKTLRSSKGSPAQFSPERHNIAATGLNAGATASSLLYPEGKALLENNPLEYAARQDVYQLGIILWQGLYQKDELSTPWDPPGLTRENYPNDHAFAIARSTFLNSVFTEKVKGYNNEQTDEFVKSKQMGQKGPIEKVLARLLEPDVSKRPSKQEALEMLHDVMPEQAMWEIQQQIDQLPSESSSSSSTSSTSSSSSTTSSTSTSRQTRLGHHRVPSK